MLNTSTIKYQGISLSRVMARAKCIFCLVLSIWSLVMRSLVHGLRPRQSGIIFAYSVALLVTTCLSSVYVSASERQQLKTEITYKGKCNGLVDALLAKAGSTVCGEKPQEVSTQPMVLTPQQQTLEPMARQQDNRASLVNMPNQARNINVDPTPVGAITQTSKALTRRNGLQSLAEIVDRSISDHPQIGQQLERLNEVKYAIRAIEANKKLQAEVRVGAGNGATGSKTTDLSLFGTSELAAAARVDGAISLKQLVYDFGGLKNDILKTQKLLTSEEFRTIEKTEEISYKVTQSYLKIIEAREMLAASERNVASLHKIASLVESNAKNGNATDADVKRVKARKSEGEVQRTELRSEMLLAMDQFRRLAKIEPGNLASPPNLTSLIARTRDESIQLANDNHPRILALNAQNSAMDNELLSQKSVAKPKIQAEAESNAKNYIGVNPRTEIDVRAMVAARYKFMDGGANKAAEDQIKSRMIQGELKHRFEREEIEADIRQFYNSLEATRAKLSNLRMGLEANTKVTELYIEQFLGGKRTLFEVLDSQQSLYMSRRGVIQNQFEERRSVYGILRSTGQLTRAILSNERAHLAVGSVKKAPVTKKMVAQKAVAEKAVAEKN
jgi:outer membrane protein, adhesin transport system